MLLAVTDAAAAGVDDAMSLTAKVTAVGTVTFACSDTVAVNVVVWLVLGSVTVTCACAAVAAARTRPHAAAKRTNVCRMTISLLPESIFRLRGHPTAEVCAPGMAVLRGSAGNCLPDNTGDDPSAVDGFFREPG
jgi:hypothetical protein